ncbi:MAG: hypothetical protein LH606_15805 [Cytophagaceae bacterium]|nr:hypothetical protein [Cytophagaceae bacterium]
MPEFVFSRSMLQDLLQQNADDALVRVVTDGDVGVFAETANVNGDSLEANTNQLRVSGCPNPPGCPNEGIAGIPNHLGRLNA